MVFQNVTIKPPGAGQTLLPFLAHLPKPSRKYKQAQLETYQSFAALFMNDLPCISESHRSDVFKALCCL
jgi:hypothetical protein